MAYGTVKADVLQSDTAGTPPQFNDGNGTQTGTLCRAWVNFNGTGTVAIRASFNVSSITDNGTGDYTINFTTALADANYAVTSEYQSDYITFSGSAATRVKFLSSQATTNCRIVTGYQYVGGGSAASDSPIVCAAIFR
jgi:hypothetical protein